MQRTRSFNEPAPLLGFSYLDKGYLGPWVIGGKSVPRPRHHLAFGGSHHGSASPEPTQPIELWSLAFDVGELREFDYLWDQPVHGAVAVRDRQRLVAAFRRVSDRFLAVPPVDPLLLKAALLEFLAVARSEFNALPIHAGTRSSAVDRAVAWMGEHLHEPGIRLPAIAGSAGLSVHHFVRAFSTALGASPMRYLRELRIRRAIGLLQATDLQIKEIAYAVGFRDQLHFSRVFRAAAGLSPQSFRTRAPRPRHALNPA